MEFLDSVKLMSEFLEIAMMTQRRGLETYNLSPGLETDWRHGLCLQPVLETSILSLDSVHFTHQIHKHTDVAALSDLYSMKEHYVLLHFVCTTRNFRIAFERKSIYYLRLETDTVSPGSAGDRLETYNMCIHSVVTATSYPPPRRRRPHPRQTGDR